MQLKDNGRISEERILLDSVETQLWFLKDPETYGIVNQAHAEFFGGRVEDFEDKKIKEVREEEDAERCVESNYQVFKNKEKLIREEWVENYRGEKRLLVITKTPIQKYSEDEICVVCRARDITENRQMENELREIEERFRSIVATLPDILIFLNKEGEYIKIWTGEEENLVASRKELIGRNFREFLPKNVADKVDYHLQKALKEVNTQVFEYQLEVIQGVKYFEARLSPTSSDEAVMVIRDITDRKKVEKRLSVQRAYFKQLFDRNPEAVVMLDNQDRILRVNKAFEEIFGYPAEEVEGENLNQLVVSSRHRQEGEELSSRVLEGEIVQKETVRKRRDGKLINVIVLGIPIQLDDEQIGVYGIYRDITERKKKEDKIKYLSFHDSLTGLYNRTYFEEELKRLDTERQLPLSIIMGDVNSLKLTNDAFGHDKGDKLLQRVADVLRSSSRSEDIIARWGGDEFIVLLPRTNFSDARKIKKRINKKCQEQECIIPVSIALGIATKENKEEKIEEVLKNAEDRMYENKMSQSNTVKESILNSLKERLLNNGFQTNKSIERMKRTAVKFGNYLGLSEMKKNKIKKIISFKDIAEITLSNELLAAEIKGDIKEDNLEELKKHTETAYHIAKNTPELAHVAEDILYHHERWDGEGFPAGLKGEEIPLTIRLITIVEDYDVMVNGRSYSKPIEGNRALQKLKDKAGKKYDPELVRGFLEVIKEKNRE